MGSFVIALWKHTCMQIQSHEGIYDLSSANKGRVA